MSTEQEEKPHPLEIALSGDPEKKNNIVPLKTNTKTQRTIINEQPWHRQFAYKLLEGKSLTQCAKIFDKSPSYLTGLKAQHWFKELITELAEQSFENDIASLLEGEAASAILTLAELAQNGKNESIRIKSASELLDKHIKLRPPPKPPTEEDPKKAMAAIEAELKRLKKQDE